MSPEQIPVVGAHVSVTHVEPAARSGCSAGTDVAVRSGVDGTFELPPLPNGRLTLRVQHDWYTARELEITVPGATREIELDRGLAWTGRVLDPDGGDRSLRRLPHPV